MTAAVLLALPYLSVWAVFWSWYSVRTVRLMGVKLHSEMCKCAQLGEMKKNP